MFRRRASFTLHPHPHRVLNRLLSGKQSNIRSRHNDADCHIRNHERKIGWKKKKVCLVFGYVGKDYRGLQMIDPAVNTIEREVEGALYSLGCILPTNRQNLDKIGWSRSSRTDKGVHAARIVVSAKLLLAPEWLYPSRTPSSQHSSSHSLSQQQQEDEKELEEGEEAQRFPGLVRQLNALLPADVRAFSCSRVNKGFQAREACHWREYEYLIPARLVLFSPEGPAGGAGAGEEEAPEPSRLFRWKEAARSEAEFVGRLNEVFSLMEGSKSMHNFHRKKESRHDVLRRQQQQEQQEQQQRAQRQTDHSAAAAAAGGGSPRHPHPVIGRDIIWPAAEDDCGYELIKQEKHHHPDLALAAAAAVAEQSSSSSGGGTGADDGDDDGDGDDGGDGGGSRRESRPRERSFRFQYEDWQPRAVKENTQGSLYLVRAAASTSAAPAAATPAAGDMTMMGDMVTIRLRGQGFLMNQIRLMVSAAVLYARGVIPLSVIHLALDAPYRLSFPLAPAEGLLLVDSGYSRNVSGQSYSLHPHHEELSKEVGGGEGEGGGGGVLSLMTACEYAASEQFKRSCIYPEVHQDWNGSDTDELSRRWFSRCGEYLVTEQLNAKFKTFLQDYQQFTAPQRQIKLEIYTRRVAASRAKYLCALATWQAVCTEARQFARQAERLTRHDRLQKDFKKREKYISQKVKAAHFEFPHKLFLPNGTPAALITEHEVLPGGPVISRALRALALAVAVQSPAVPALFRDAAHVVQHVSSSSSSSSSRQEGEGGAAAGGGEECGKGGIWRWAEREPVCPHIQ